MPPVVGVVITFAGELRTLRYTAAVLARVQRELGGEALLDSINQLGRGSMRHLSVFTCCGLLHELPDLTADKVLEVMEPPIVAASKSCLEALSPWVRSSAPAAADAEKKSATTPA